MYKTVEEATEAVDVMFAATAIKVGGMLLISGSRGYNAYVGFRGYHQ